MRKRLGFETWLALAFVTHGVLLVGLALRSHVRPRQRFVAEREEKAPIDVALDWTEPKVRAPADVAPPEEGIAVTPRAREVGRLAALAPAATSGDVLAAPSEPTAAPSAAPDDGEWTFSPVASAAPDLGVAGNPGSGSVRGAFREAAHEARVGGGGEGAVASVKAALDAHDRDVGLGAGGPLVNLARDAVRDSLTPTIGHALFELSTNAAGLVLSVRVLDASSSRRSWEDVATRLAETARAHPLRVPPGAKGVAVTLRVDSVFRTKSAHDAGETSVSLLGVPLKRSNAQHPVHVDLSIPIASMNIDPTDALLDATSIPERVVSVWITREERL